MKNATIVAKHMKENATIYAEQIVDKIADTLGLDIPEAHKKPARVMYEKFFEFLSESLEIDTYRVPNEWLKWTKVNAEKSVASGRDITTLVSNYPLARDIATDFITKMCIEHDGTVYGTSYLVRKVNAMFDNSIQETLWAYEQKKKETESQLREELAEMSAPHVLIADKTYLVPLIGTIDESRAEYMVDHTFKEIRKSQADYVIIDFSGATKVGESTIHHYNLIEMLVNVLYSTIIITGAGQELLRLLSNLLEKRENIELCSSVAEAVDIARKFYQETEDVE